MKLSFCSDAMVPEIPRIQDVLFALGLSMEEEYYTLCACNHEPYIANINLVVVACAGKILGTNPYDEQEARRIVAKTIVSFCPEEAQCLFVDAYVKALEIAEGKNLNLPHTSEELKEMCGCRNCRQKLAA